MLIGMMNVSGDEKKSITVDSTGCIPLARTSFSSFFFFFPVFFFSPKNKQSVSGVQ